MPVHLGRSRYDPVMLDCGVSDAEPRPVLLVSHDTRLAGAQRCLLELAHVLKNERGRRVELASCGDGELLSEFEQIAPVARLHDRDGGVRSAANALVSAFKRRFPDGLILVNTSAIADVYRALDDQGVRDAQAWIHELPPSIDSHYGGAATVALVDRVVRQIIVPCEFARDALRARYQVAAGKIVALPNGVARQVVRGAEEIDRAAARQSLRTIIGAPAGALVVLGCGTGDRRKGVDLFGRVAAEVCRAASVPVHFVWLGSETDPEIRTLAQQAMERARFPDRLHFVPSSDAPERYYAGSDLFLITSREDPSPLVQAEAMMFELPVVFFEGAGGAGEQQPPEVDLGVAGFDTDAMATRVLALLGDAGERHEIGARLGRHVRGRSRGRGSPRASKQISPDPTPDVRATAREVLRTHESRGADRPRDQRILLILPDVQIGGGQLNAIRLANMLTATHQVFMLNARPSLHDPSVATLISPKVIPLEGSLHRTSHYDHAEAWTRGPDHIDERPHRVRVVAELLKELRIGTVLSQVWWSDRFALALYDVADFDWFVKLCGCYELLLRHPLMDPTFVPKTRRILEVGRGPDLRLGDEPGGPGGSAVLPPAGAPSDLQRVLSGLIDREAAPSPPRSPGDFVFCICSRAVKEKGWEEAILATARINRRPDRARGGKRAKLWLIGDGPGLLALRGRYAAERMSSSWDNRPTRIRSWPRPTPACCPRIPRASPRR